MKTARRFSEFDFLKIFSLLLLFAFHSSLRILYYEPLWFIQTYFLSAFFLISGYLFVLSIRKYSATSLLKSKFFRLHTPLLIGLFLVFAVSLMYNTNPLAYFFHAVLLSVFWVLQANDLNLFHLWFLVHLMIYYLFFLALYKKVNSEKLRIVSTAAFFFFITYLFSVESEFRLEWKFGFFILLFYAGMLLAENDRLSRTYKFIGSKWGIILLLLLIVGTFGTPNINTGIAALDGTINTALFIIIRNAWALSACLLSLWLFSKIKNPKAVYYANKIAYGTLFAYILQPIISMYVSCLWMLNGYCSADYLTVEQLMVMLPISIVITLTLAYFMQKYYDRIIARIS